MTFFQVDEPTDFESRDKSVWCLCNSVTMFITLKMFLWHPKCQCGGQGALADAEYPSLLCNSVSLHKNLVFSLGSHLFKYGALCTGSSISPIHSIQARAAGKHYSFFRSLAAVSKSNLFIITTVFSSDVQMTWKTQQSYVQSSRRQTSITSQGGDTYNCPRAKSRDMLDRTGPRTRKPVGLEKHRPKQKDQQGIDNENKPATCASSDESWQAHQGPSSE